MDRHLDRLCVAGATAGAAFARQFHPRHRAGDARSVSRSAIDGEKNRPHLRADEPDQSVPERSANLPRLGRHDRTLYFWRANGRIGDYLRPALPWLWFVFEPRIFPARASVSIADPRCNFAL